MVRSSNGQASIAVDGAEGTQTRSALAAMAAAGWPDWACEGLLGWYAHLAAAAGQPSRAAGIGPIKEDGIEGKSTRDAVAIMKNGPDATGARPTPTEAPTPTGSAEDAKQRELYTSKRQEGNQTFEKHVKGLDKLYGAGTETDFRKDWKASTTRLDAAIAKNDWKAAAAVRKERQFMLAQVEAHAKGEVH